MHLISVSTDSTNYKIYECFIIQKNKKFLHSNISFKYKLDILRRCLNIDLYKKNLKNKTIQKLFLFL